MSQRAAPAPLSRTHLVAASEARSGLRVNRTAAANLVAAIAILGVHAFASSQLNIVQRLLGAIPGIVAAILVVRYLRDRRLQRLPFLEYAAVQFYLYWGMPTLTFKGGARNTFVSEAAVTASLIAVNVVVAGVLLAAPMGERLGARLASKVERTLPAVAPERIPLLFGAWIALALTVHAGWAAEAVPAEYRNVVIFLGSFVPLIVAVAMNVASKGRRGQIVLWGTVLLFSTVGLFTGMMEKVISPLFVAALVTFFYRRSIPIRLVVVLAALMFIINPTKHVYRSIAWTDAERRTERDPFTALTNWGEAFRRTWLEGEVTTGEKVEGLGDRFNELAYIAPTFELCPSVIPFQRGADWLFIPLSVVPRAFYPDKPDYTEIFNNRFNIAFGFQSFEMTLSSTNSFPLVSDGYWNFGWPGVVVVGLLVGLALGVFGRAFSTRTWGGMSLAAVVFTDLHAHTHLARLFTGTLQQYVAVAVVCWTVWLAGKGAARARGRGRVRDLKAAAYRP